MPGLVPSLPDLPAALWSLLAQIPCGRVTTYGELAKALGSHAAARWVGEYMVDHPHERGCPCHRVVRKTGEVGLYITRDVADKVRLLEDEGVPVHNGRVDVPRYDFRDFESDEPLVALAAYQESLPGRIRLEPFRGLPATVGGVDVSYRPPCRGVGSYALLDVEEGRLLWSTTVQTDVRFPYIPGFLAYRELPVLTELIEKVRAERQQADVLLVDGNGLLHPRHAGVACHFGVLVDRPTIGIGKKLLCGSVDLTDMRGDEARPVTHDGEIVGAAVKATTANKPVFVSPGHRMDVESAVHIARALFHGHRAPEPIYWADRLSRQAAENASQ